MKTLTKEIWMEAPQRRAIISIHREVERLVAESGVQDGLVLVNTKQILSIPFVGEHRYLRSPPKQHLSIHRS